VRLHIRRHGSHGPLVDYLHSRPFIETVNDVVKVSMKT
jgi:hypothetical protein